MNQSSLCNDGSSFPLFELFEELGLAARAEIGTLVVGVREAVGKVHDTPGIGAVAEREHMTQFVDCFLGRPLGEEGSFEPGNGDNSVGAGTVPEDEVQSFDV